jgi:23S rRNA-/tRNA-specific pseudouridylate synthase
VPLHRLDLGTSGVCLFAQTPECAGEWSRRLGEAEKTYLALAKGVLHKRGRIQRPIFEAGRKLEASTRYERMEVVGGHSLLRVQIDTGRKHQIRKHLSGIGHPVIGDARYGDKATQRHFAMRHGLDRAFLHCASMSLSWDDQRLEVTAPLAGDLELVLESLSQRERPGRTS